MRRQVLLFVLVTCMSVIGCARDVYQQRADVMKSHVEAFYQDLRTDRVAAATIENEHIESLAVQIEDGILRRQNQLAATDIDRDWMQARAAREAALENWLALAKYLTLKRQYDQARGTYQRILSTYKDPRYHAYAEQARAGLRDLDLILAPAKGTGS